MKISIILSTYNWPKALDVILSNLAPQLAKHDDVELVIADDGSTKATEVVIKRRAMEIPNLNHVWHEDDGFRKSSILNKAVAVSKGEYLVFLDGDCIPFPDYIEQHMKLVESGYFVAGNRVLLSKEFSEEVMDYPEKLADMFNWSVFKWVMAKLAKKVNKSLPGLRFGNGKWRYSRDTNWKYPKGCNFAVAKDAFLAVNGFDEVFSGWGHEDADLFVRFLHNGIKIKDGRFAIPVLHLWHKNADRDNEPENSERLMDRVNDNTITQAESGVSAYLKSVQEVGNEK